MIGKLHEAIAAAGLPVVSVRKHADGSFTADLDNGTPEQYAQAQAIIDGFDTAKEEHNASIDAQIAALERAVTERRKREALLTDAGRTWLAGVDAQIATLRGQRQ